MTNQRRNVEKLAIYIGSMSIHHPVITHPSYLISIPKIHSRCS